MVLRRGKQGPQANADKRPASPRVPWDSNIDQIPTSPLVEGVSRASSFFAFFSLSLLLVGRQISSLIYMPRPPNYDQNYINAQHEAAAYNGGAGAGQQPIMEDQQEVGEEGYGTFALPTTRFCAPPGAALRLKDSTSVWAKPASSLVWRRMTSWKGES